MLANLAMLIIGYGLLVVPLVWLARPVRMVNPFWTCGLPVQIRSSARRNRS
jgi:hypothetical protein